MPILNETHMQEPWEPSKYIRWRKTLSFPYERTVDVDSQLQLIVYIYIPSTYFRDGDTIVEFTADDLVTPTQGPSAQCSKGTKHNIH